MTHYIKNILILILVLFLSAPALAQDGFPTPLQGATTGVRDPNASYSCFDYQGNPTDDAHCLSVPLPPISCPVATGGGPNDQGDDKVRDPDTGREVNQDRL